MYYTAAGENQNLISICNSDNCSFEAIHFEKEFNIYPASGTS